MLLWTSKSLSADFPVKSSLIEAGKQKLLFELLLIFLETLVLEFHIVAVRVFNTKVLSCRKEPKASKSLNTYSV